MPRFRSPSPDRNSHGDRERAYAGSSRTDDHSGKRGRDNEYSGVSRHARSRSPDGDKKVKRRKRDKSVERKERKAEKQRIREEEEARQVAELSVYSATDNPFHDANLGQQFRWHKKADKDRKSGLSLAEAQRRDALRRQEAKEELERLNRRRAEREVEQRIRDEEEARMGRLAESAQMAEWIAKDEVFQLEQEKRRAGIRLKEKRAKAIDFLALNLKYAGDVDDEEEDGLGLDDTGLEIDLDEPYAIFENLELAQTEELHEDIERYLTLETSKVNIDFWTNMMVVCKDRLERLRASVRMGSDVLASHAAVEAEISVLLSGKSYEQLVALQQQVQAKLSSGEPLDTDYWEGLLKSLFVWKAKAKLKSVHEVVVRNRLEQLRKRQRDEAFQAQEELLAGVAKKNAYSRHQTHDPESETTGRVVRDLISSKTENIDIYDRSMSPELIDITQLPYEERGIDIYTAEEDHEALLTLRRSVASSRFVTKQHQQEEVVPDTEITTGFDMDAEALYRAEAEKQLDEEEELFNVEENITSTTYTWEDKYRPRKPRYFNRVHTGYEWNKYNQTHYDTDNPPPKVVQGYKFNIFYPDLIDKSKAPIYKLVRTPGDTETALLHFSAGPPYEDIAFRIVDREWEYSHKRGFRSSFDRGCLSLWFNFRRNVRTRTS
ncbi:mid region of cactin-domain-containing protein [Hysterangium stoloniferum]|nr:mid region of cactin-domain-containing protein [Hysterangium stoloniferum]